MPSSDLSSFGSGLTVAVFGAHDGIGAALVSEFEKTENVERIYSFSRKQPAMIGAKETNHRFNLNDEDSIKFASEIVGSEVQIVFVATGLLQDVDHGIAPEKTIKTLNPDAALHSYAINTIGPMLIAKHFLGNLSRERKSVFAVISARVGSISDNRIGGWYSYRASKAALNQMIKCSAIELHRKNKKGLCVALHPGTVDTKLSKPFQANVPSQKLFKPEMSARAMINVLNDLEPTDSGKVVAYDGKEIDP